MSAQRPQYKATAASLPSAKPRFFNLDLPNAFPTPSIVGICRCFHSGRRQSSGIS